MPANTTKPAWLIRPVDPPPFEWTDRRRFIVVLLSNNALMSLTDIHRVVGGSLRGVRNDCKILWQHGYIVRPATQSPYIDELHHHGGPSLLYALARKGARWLVARGHSLEHRVDQSFRDPAPSQIPHTLAITRFMLDLHAAAKARGLAVLDHADLLQHMPEATRQSRRPFQLSVTTSERGRSVRLAVRPDRLCALLLPDEQRLNLALEIDRGTESIRNKITHKLKTYRHGFLENRHRDVWGFQRFRVLFTTTSVNRIATMLDAQHHNVTNGHLASMFLYTDRARLAAHGILGPAWLTADAAPIAEELAHQASLRDSNGRLVTRRPTRIRRLAKILADIGGISVLPPQLMEIP